MTSFNPLWTAKVADHEDASALSDAQPTAPRAFVPLWQGGGKPDFVLTQFQSGKDAIKTANSNVEPGVEVQEKVAANPDSSVSVELPAAESADPAISVERATASEVLVPAPPEIPMITCEEHAKLLQIERAAGVEAGRLEGLAEAAKMIDSERKKIGVFLASIEATFGNSAEFFAPLKKLALHIAQQLVRGELQLSGAAISRLIENCLAVAGNRKPLVIRVHPQDLEMFRKLRGEDGDDLPFKEDPSFTPGSVRVEFDGWIDDRMEERVDEVSKALQVSSACAPSSACNGS